MNKRKTALLFFSCISLNLALAQTDITTPQVSLSEKPPPAPNSGSLSRYFEIPVNMASGIPGIQIPLYTIQSGNIRIPVTLSYHAGGIKVNSEASWIGTGWSLNAGASINKKVNGFDDLYTAEQSTNNGPQYNYIDAYYNNYIPGYGSITEIVEMYGNSARDQDSINNFWGRLASGYVDGEADEYFFSTPEGGGCIFYNQKTQTYQNKKPDGWLASYDTYSNDEWILLSKNGIRYDFSAVEMIVNPVWKSWEHGGDYHPQTEYIPSAWYPTVITDTANGKSVSFSYDSYNQQEKSIGYSGTVEYRIHPSSGLYNYGETGSGSLVYRDGYELSVNKISFDQGRVEFIKDTAARSDGVGTKALKEIKIYNNDSVLLKKYSFTYFYPVAGSARLFLASVKEVIYDGRGNAIEMPPYRFDYDTSIHLPGYTSNAQDYWGYYNGKTSNTSLFPTIVPSAYGVPTQSDRKVDTSYTRAGTLKKIVYPTGGSLNFQYENNTTVNDTTYTGGLRIKRITNFDSVAGKTLIKEYDYQNSGSVLFQPTFYYFYIYQGTGVGSTESRVRIYGDPMYPLFPNQGSPVLYRTVIEKQIGDGGEIRTRHYFTDYGFYMSLTGNGTTMQNGIGVPHNKIPIPEDFIGLEYKTEVFKSNGGGSFTRIEADSLEYSYIRKGSDTIWNVQAAWVSPGGGSEWFIWPSNDPFNQFPAYGFAATNMYQVIQEAPVKTKKYTLYTDEQNTITQGSFYEYDGTNGNIKTITTVDSKGDTTIAKIRYASDYISTGSYPSVNYEIKSLKDNNMLSAPIETITLLKKKDSTNSIVQSAELYEYENLKVKKVYKVFGDVPLNSFTVSYNDANGFYKDSRYQLQEEVTAWNGKKPKTVISNTNKMSYVWDDKYQAPIAIVSNASYEDAAFTSFEGQSDGSWTVGSSNRNKTWFITGKRSYRLDSASVSKSGLSSGKQYIVSYWSRNGSYSVSGSTETKQGKTVDGWTYYQHTVTGVTSVTVSSGSTAYIDELRIYPKAAQMVSYCYSELVGLTSQCDAANQVNYYEYYGPDKLMVIRDQEKNVLKKICYNYAGQPEYDCNPLYFNVVKSGNFTRNNCPANYTGSTVTYTVAASTYSSTFGQAYVDSVAQADVNANGQNYANANGTCTPDCNSQTCTGQAYKCVNGVCEQGVQVVTECIYDDLQNTYTYTYHYEWSDSSWSQDYTVYNADSCP